MAEAAMHVPTQAAASTVANGLEFVTNVRAFAQALSNFAQWGLNEVSTRSGSDGLIPIESLTH